MKTILDRNDLRLFLDTQLKEWPQAQTNYAAMGHCLQRQIEVDGEVIRLQFNPGRQRSTTADTSAIEIARRDCFLCAKHRPKTQKKRRLGSFDLLVNPFPVFEEHYTLAHVLHVEQRIKPHVRSFFRMLDRLPDMTLFYNGAQCGASAPDHAHFQACLWEQPEVPHRGSLIYQEGTTTLSEGVSSLRPAWLLEGCSSASMSQVLFSLLDFLSPNEEPNVNLLAWKRGERSYCLIFPRSRHRPEVYFRSDEGQRLVSPAAVEMGGFLVCSRQRDFEQLNAAEIREIYASVCWSTQKIQAHRIALQEHLRNSAHA